MYIYFGAIRYLCLNLRIDFYYIGELNQISINYVYGMGTIYEIADMHAKLIEVWERICLTYGTTTVYHKVWNWLLVSVLFGIWKKAQ